MSDLSSAQRTKPKKDTIQSVKRLLLILIGAVFVSEALVMEVMRLLPSMSRVGNTLLDATLLSLLLFPFFYLLIFRPLIRRIAESKLIEDDLRIAAVAFEIKDPCVITDADANIIRANQKFLAKSGYSMEEIVGKNPRIFKSGLHDQQFYEQMWRRIEERGSWCNEIRIKNKDGRILHPFWLTITAIKDEQQKTTHYIGIYNF
ncbi:MAG: PAS domain S-box protein [Gammaproteobacteria bacterium]|nr:PAS domain S-box protein [Gammaproteobacteria bacterium]MBU1625366.1 PAS domain S-box protein [Gammaproteobacteria bacterium]MBU1981626.1 PAS domain S-box protein [Gammaproteobacteria bacterium]